MGQCRIKHQNKLLDKEQTGPPIKGHRSKKEGRPGGMLSNANASEGQTDKRASGARSSQATQAQEAHHNKYQLEREPTQSTIHMRPSEGGDNIAETSSHMDARETKTYARLTPPSAPAPPALSCPAAGSLPLALPLALPLPLRLDSRSSAAARRHTTDGPSRRDADGGGRPVR